jgi:hypothetical protein
MRSACHQRLQLREMAVDLGHGGAVSLLGLFVRHNVKHKGFMEHTVTLKGQGAQPRLALRAALLTRHNPRNHRNSRSVGPEGCAESTGDARVQPGRSTG